MQELADKLACWIGEQTTKAGKKGCVLGLSGGLDSSVVAVLCKRALPNDTLAVMMPCHSSREDMEHARLLSDRFGITVETVELDDTFDSLLQAIPEMNGLQQTKKAAEANIKPRLRMTTLYYFAAILDYLVVGTSNRSELSVGYFSKHGDAGVDIIPLGNLVKGQVINLARYLGIPEEIISKPPSAGLWQGQTDESEIGISYEELDHYLLKGKASDEAESKIEAMIANSQHKRALPPIPPF